MADLSDYKLQQMTWELGGECTGGELIASPSDYRGRGIAVDIMLDGEPLDVGDHHVYLLWRHRQARKRGTEELFSMDAAAGRKAVYWPRTMASMEGVAECQLVLSYADGGSISSRTFLVRVQEDLLGGVDSGDGFTLFVDVIKRYEDATADLLGVAEDLRREAAEGGFNGAPGKDGAPGPQGEPGPAGPAGADGAPGRDGTDGKDGAPGRDGADGAPGRDGVSPKVTIEGDADGGAVMKVECDGVVTQATVLRGPKGEKGDDGAAGPAGEKGDPGERGPQGEKGEKGDPGEKGEKGDKGDPGEKGEKGDPGEGGGRAGTQICPIYADSTFTLGTDSTGFNRYLSSLLSSNVLEKNDFIVDYNRNLCQILNRELYRAADGKYPDSYKYTVKLIGSLRGLKLVLVTGLDVKPGETTDDYFALDNVVARVGDYVFSVDTGCIGIVEEVETENEYESGVIVTGVSRLGAPDLSSYATKEFVTEKIAAAIPADLTEVSF